jgi:glycolate oxidase iron-sulfur subunit
MVHAGQEEQALEFARKLIDSFERAGVDAIIINAAGCGSTMKDYGYILRNDPRYAERAKAFSAKCKDVSEVLAELEPRATRHPMPLRIAYHDSCHLQHAQGIRTEPRKVLKTIPQLELLEIPDSAICCGSAGIYNLVQPDTAAQLGDLKVKNCLSTKPDLVVSANPGCLIQISSGLKRAGKQIPVLHMIELMDAAIRGVPAAQLQADGHKK